ncbi:MAG: hypothetical protein ABIV50_00395 [Opitutus sp.]
MNSIVSIIVNPSVRAARALTVCSFLIAPLVFGAPPPVTVVQPVQVEVVNATPIPVTGTVAITHQGPLDVNLAGNGPDAPVYVQPSLQKSWRTSFFLLPPTGSRAATWVMPNNSGARLMIQQITTTGRIRPTEAYQFLEIGIRSIPPKAALTPGMGILKPTLDGTDPYVADVNHYSASTQVTLYLEPGEELNLTAIMSAPGGVAFATVAGLILD